MRALDFQRIKETEEALERAAAPPWDLIWVGAIGVAVAIVLGAYLAAIGHVGLAMFLVGLGGVLVGRLFGLLVSWQRDVHDIRDLQESIHELVRERLGGGDDEC